MFQPDPRRLGNTLSPSKSLCMKMGRGARHVSLIYRGSHQTPVNMPLHGWYRMLRTCTRKYDVNEQPLKKNDSQRLKELVFPDLKKEEECLDRQRDHYPQQRKKMVVEIVFAPQVCYQSFVTHNDCRQLNDSA